MKQLLVDTGAWYALVYRNDPDHAAVQTCLRTTTQPLVITDYILCEKLTLLRYRLGWKTAHVFGTSVLDGDIGVLSDVTRLDREAAWQIFTRYRDKSFSFTDCTSFAHMERLKIDAAVALDHDFRGYGLLCMP